MKTRIKHPLSWLSKGWPFLALWLCLVAGVHSAFAQSAPFTTFVQATGTVTIVGGFIIGANLVNDGSGYPAPPAVSVVDPSGSNAVIVAAISGDGVVTNLSINNAGSHYSAGAALIIAAPPTNANPSDINIIMSRYVTADIRTWSSGTNYPAGGFYANYAGITFYFMGFPGITNGLGIVLAGVGSVAAPKTNNFPVNVTNAVAVYTLMNSEYGKLGSTNGTLEFYGDQGAHASFNLVQGFNLRDHYNGGYQNTVSSNIMRLVWGASKSVRLDCQGWLLPAIFDSQTLTNIQVRSFGNNPNGIPTIAAITIRTAGPALALNPMGNQMVCGWPSTPTNFVLQTTPSLDHPAWMTATTSPPVTNNQFVVTNLIALTNQFYRLIAVP
jgi:hypothetical protein